MENLIEKLQIYYLKGRRKKKARKDVSRIKWRRYRYKEMELGTYLESFIIISSILFALTFLNINTDKLIIDLLAFIAVGGLLVSGGIFLNYLLSKGK